MLAVLSSAAKEFSIKKCLHTKYFMLREVLMLNLRDYICNAVSSRQIFDKDQYYLVLPTPFSQ